MKKLASTIFAAALAFTLTACGDQASTTGTGSSNSNSDSQAAKPKPTLDGATANNNQSAAPRETGGDCDKSFDLGDTALGPSLNVDRFPMVSAGSSRMFLHGKMNENKFDPCATLSWVVLEGAQGDASGPGGTGGSVASGVAFFNKSELITSHKSAVFNRLKSVTRIDDSTVQVVYGMLDGPRAAQTYKDYPVTYKWDGSQLKVEDPNSEQQALVSGLDFSIPNNQHDAPKQKYGNVYKQGGGDKEIQAQGSSVTFAVKFAGNSEMLCKKDLAGGRTTCGVTPNPGWKEFTNNSFSPVNSPTGTGGQANTFTFEFMPHAVTKVDSSMPLNSGIPAGTEYASESGVTKLPGMYVDTTDPNRIVFRPGADGIGIVVTADGPMNGQ